MARGLVVALFAALLVSAAVATSLDAELNPSGRRLLQGGGGWDGGINTQTILAENDAKAGIESAVQNDQFSSSYQATNAGYRDAFAAIFPEDNNGEFWLSAGTQNSAG